MFSNRTHSLAAVDVVPGVLQIETSVDCLEWLPIHVPKSELVVHPGERDEQRFAIPTSRRTVVLMAGRLIAAITAIVAATIVVVGLSTQGALRDFAPFGSILFCVAIGLGAIVWFMPGLVRANYERAQHLAEFAHLDSEIRLEIDVAFGLLTTDQAVSELKRRDRSKGRRSEGVDSRIIQLFSSTW